MKRLTYVEIDVDFCANTYGVAPCTASVGVTGTRKCFNSLNTCQDRPNYSESGLTLRFAMPSDYLPRSIPCTPSIMSISYTPAVISFGENLGQRAQIQVAFKDHSHSDTGIDPYLSDRTYNPFSLGTYWGKMRARRPFLRGRRLRLITGLLGQTLEEMETRHYIIESFDGPTAGGTYSILAQDVIKLLDGPRSQAPFLNTGFLSAGISEVAGSASLLPVDIGDNEYAASGYLVIAGKEVVSFTRVGNALTLTGRGLFGTEARAHEAQDRVQEGLYISGQTPSEIFQLLLNTYVDGWDPAWNDVAAWDAELDAYLDQVYTAFIAEPTGVRQLMSELIEQAGLCTWWNDITQLLKLRVIRAVSTTADVFNRVNMLDGAYNTREQPDKRISEVWVYFGQRNPCEPQDRPDNYRSVVATPDAQGISDNGSSAVKRIFSRWIPFGGRVVASKLTDLILGRFSIPPRRFQFSTFREGSLEPELGGGYNITELNLQDDTGAQVTAPIQVQSLDPQIDKYVVTAEEMLFSSSFQTDLTQRTIIVDFNSNNLNMKSLHDALYPEIAEEDVGYVTVTCIIQESIIVGSTDANVPAFIVGDWLPGLDLVLQVNGRIQGKGGNGGDGVGPANSSYPTGEPGKIGGPALYTRSDIDVEVGPDGEIWGGAGGGGGGGAGASSGNITGGGGGGAGTTPGLGGGGGSGGGPNGNNATADNAGGGNGRGGAGGEPGNPGHDGQDGAGASSGAGGAGGDAGAAVDGDSYVTYTLDPDADIRGSLIN